VSLQRWRKQGEAEQNRGKRAGEVEEERGEGSWEKVLRVGWSMRSPVTHLVAGDDACPSVGLMCNDGDGRRREMGRKRMGSRGSWVKGGRCRAWTEREEGMQGFGNSLWDK